MNRAIANKTDWSSSNTRVEFNDSTNCSSVFLHGHNIATVDHSTNAVKISSCGWQTNTTKSRLNAILSDVNPSCGVYQKDWTWYLNDNLGTVPFTSGVEVNY